MTGAQLYDLLTSLNGGATIGVDIANSLLATAQTIIEGQRPWMVLRKRNTSKTVTTSNTWQTAIDLSTITDLSRFYGELPIKLFDGTNLIDHYRVVAYDKQLEYKDIGATACYNHATKQLYLNGLVAFNGTLYIDYIATGADIDVTATTDVWAEFPSRFTPLLAFYAIGIHQGGVDYDDISARQAPTNIEVMHALQNALETWDTNLQMTEIDTNDPTEYYGMPRLGTVNRYDNS